MLQYASLLFLIYDSHIQTQRWETELTGKPTRSRWLASPSYPIKCKITGSAQNWTTIYIIHGKASAICVNTFLHTHILIWAVKAYVGYIELDLGLRFTFLIPHQCAISQRLARRMQVLISRWQRSKKSKYKATEVEKSIIVRILEENLKRKTLFHKLIYTYCYLWHIVKWFSHLIFSIFACKPEKAKTEIENQRAVRKWEITSVRHVLFG